MKGNWEWKNVSHDQEDLSAELLLNEERKLLGLDMEYVVDIQQILA